MLFAIIENKGIENRKRRPIMALSTNDASFETDVLKSDVPVIVDFWAPWCGPCRMIAPIIERVSEKLNGSARIYKLNVDENPGTAGKYGIMGIPTVMVFKNGQVDKQFVGVQPEYVYLNALNG
jgi:thioredoxin 1